MYARVRAVGARSFVPTPFAVLPPPSLPPWFRAQADVSTPRLLPVGPSGAAWDVVRALVHEVPFPVPGALAVHVDVGGGAAVPFVWRTGPDSLPHVPFRLHALFQQTKVGRPCMHAVCALCALFCTLCELCVLLCALCVLCVRCVCAVCVCAVCVLLGVFLNVILPSPPLCHPANPRIGPAGGTQAEHLTLLLSAMLCERKVIVSSKHMEVLALYAELLVALLYPFRWQCLYVPVLPSNIAVECVQVRGSCFHARPRVGAPEDPARRLPPPPWPCTPLSTAPFLPHRPTPLYRAPSLPSPSLSSSLPVTSHPPARYHARARCNAPRRVPLFERLHPPWGAVECCSHRPRYRTCTAS